MAAESSNNSDVYDLCPPEPEECLGKEADQSQPEHPSVISHMVRSLMPGQDLTRVMIPSFFLETRSLLEKMADVFMHPQLIIEYVVMYFLHQFCCFVSATSH